MLHTLASSNNFLRQLVYVILRMSKSFPVPDRFKLCLKKLSIGDAFPSCYSKFSKLDFSGGGDINLLSSNYLYLSSTLCLSNSRSLSKSLSLYSLLLCSSSSYYYFYSLNVSANFCYRRDY